MINNAIPSGRGEINSNFTEGEAADLTRQLNQRHGRSLQQMSEQNSCSGDRERPLAGQPALLVGPGPVAGVARQRLVVGMTAAGDNGRMNPAPLLVAGPQAPRTGVIAMSLAPADASRWTNPPSRAEVVEMISQAGAHWCGAPTNTVSDLGEDVSVMNLDCPLPVTYAFRTVEEPGLLTDYRCRQQPPSVRIRYKLVESEKN